MTAAAGARLHFVYNVDGTPLALAMDFVHRITAPERYPCRLCDVTYGRFVKKGAWRRFLAGLPVASTFHLRNTFRRRFPACADAELPAVFLESPPGTLRPLIRAAELRAVDDLGALCQLVTAKLEGSAAQGPPV